MLAEVPDVDLYSAKHEKIGYRVQKAYVSAYTGKRSQYDIVQNLWIYPCCDGFSWHVFDKNGKPVVKEGFGTPRLALVAAKEYQEFQAAEVIRLKKEQQELRKQRMAAWVKEKAEKEERLRLREQKRLQKALLKVERLKRKQERERRKEEKLHASTASR